MGTDGDTHPLVQKIIPSSSVMKFFFRPPILSWFYNNNQLRRGEVYFQKFFDCSQDGKYKKGYTSTINQNSNIRSNNWIVLIIILIHAINNTLFTHNYRVPLGWWTPLSFFHHGRNQRVPGSLLPSEFHVAIHTCTGYSTSSTNSLWVDTLVYALQGQLIHFKHLFLEHVLIFEFLQLRLQLLDPRTMKNIRKTYLVT